MNNSPSSEITCHNYGADLCIVSDCYYCAGSALQSAYDNVSDHCFPNPHRWHYQRCATCQSLILSARPNEQDLVAYYPHASAPASSRESQRIITRLFSAVYSHHVYGHQARAITRLLKVKKGKGKKLLDIGCGEGELLRECQALGFTVVGVEQRPEAVARVNAMGIQTMCASVDTVDSFFAKESFDVVTAFHVIEHITTPHQALAKWVTLLKPGGILILGAPVIDSLQADIFGRHWSAMRAAPRHVSIPSKQALVALLSRAGFENSNVIADSIFYNATSLSWTLFPGVLKAGSWDVRSPMKKRISIIVWLVGIYLLWPVAWIETVLFRRPGMCIAVAKRP